MSPPLAARTPSPRATREPPHPAAPRATPPPAAPPTLVADPRAAPRAPALIVRAFGLGALRDDAAARAPRVEALDPAAAATGARCALCGVPLPPGSPALPDTLGASFADDRWMATHSGVECLDCAVAICKPVLDRMGAALCSASAALSLATDASRAYLFTAPASAFVDELAPPFVILCSARTLAHTPWRARVTMDPALLWVRFDDHQFCVRRALVAEAVAACGVVAAAIRDAGRRVGAHPYRSLDRKLETDLHGRLREDAVVAEATAEGRAALAVLRRCALGETWALSALVKAKPAPPERPPRQAPLRAIKDVVTDGLARAQVQARARTRAHAGAHAGAHTDVPAGTA